MAGNRAPVEVIRNDLSFAVAQFEFHKMDRGETGRPRNLSDVGCGSRRRGDRILVIVFKPAIDVVDSYANSGEAGQPSRRIVNDHHVKIVLVHLHMDWLTRLSVPQNNDALASRS